MSDTSNATATDNNDVVGNADDTTADSRRAGSEHSVLADLAAERKARQAAEKRAKDVETRLSKIEEASKSDHEKALDKARQEAATEARKEALSVANARVLSSEVRALAADKFADPEDPLAALDLSKFEVDDDGNVDRKAIANALDSVLKQKPHWAKATAKTTGSADQGATGRSPGGMSMNDLIRKKAGYA